MHSFDAHVIVVSSDAVTVVAGLRMAVPEALDSKGRHRRYNRTLRGPTSSKVQTLSHS